MLTDFFWLCVEYLCISSLAYIAFCMARLFFADRVYPWLIDLHECPLQKYSYNRMMRYVWFFVITVACLVVCYIAWSWRFAVTSSCLWVLKYILVGPSSQNHELVLLFKMVYLNIQSYRAIVRE
ncbi:hypothetical protein [Duganella vulcania]|uniref:Uncharacterized protein n=1 Tax=Duganella vulcania TaxID=2692166 RepID=A0A845GH99_9BURK|nr:hypothetical protein [Duganella vulcania]MYM92802.1 hypothetical protein [Duganella vulcania]